MSEEGAAGRQRLAEVITASRADLETVLLSFEWAADPGRPEELIVGAQAVRPRVDLFIDLLVEGLATGDWTAFDEDIGARTIELLGAGRITEEDLRRRALTITSVLIPHVLRSPEPDLLLMALFDTVHTLSGRIAAGHNRHLMEELERVDDVKTMVLRVTTHELRTPLATIRGYVSMLEAGDLGVLQPPTQQAIRAIDRATGATLNLLDRLGEMARLESGTERPLRAAQRLSAVVEAAVGPLREGARLKSVELTTEVGVGEAMIDLEEMAIAIRNLIGNALKYASDGGRIAVRAAIEGEEAVFEVADHGPGIAAEELPQVFDRYFRASQSRSSGMVGSGLGLYIVKRIAELHGGVATAESTVGEGSTFRIRIPVGH